MAKRNSNGERVSLLTAQFLMESFKRWLETPSDLMILGAMRNDKEWERLKRAFPKWGASAGPRPKTIRFSKMGDITESKDETTQ